MVNKEDRAQRFVWAAGDIEIIPSEKPVEKAFQDKRAMIRKGLNKLITNLNVIIKGELKREQVHKIEKELPKPTLDIFDSDAQKVLKKIYIKNRLANNNIEKSLHVATRIVLRNFKNNKLVIIKSIEKELKRIYFNLKRR